MNEPDHPHDAPPSRPRRNHMGAACYQEGEYWTLVYGGLLCRLRNARGLHCLAHLLRHPGRKFTAAALLEVAEESRSRRRREDAAQIDAERARVLVTKHIRGVIRKIRRHHPSLAHHLDACIRTGAQCVYQPDPGQPVHWAKE